MGHVSLAELFRQSSSSLPDVDVVRLISDADAERSSSPSDGVASAVGSMVSSWFSACICEHFLQNLSWFCKIQNQYYFSLSKVGHIFGELITWFCPSIRAPDKLRICVFYAMKTSKNACIIRSECTYYAYILLCKQTFEIRSVLVQSCT